jgi:hypothetical protein
LRLEPRDDAGQNHLAANFAQRLVSAAHSARQAAGENNPRYVKSFCHGGYLVACPSADPASSAWVVSPRLRNIGSV